MKKLLLIFCSIHAITTLSAQWSLSGNSISTGNFIGTTNNQSLVFKANNQFAGTIDVSFQNTFLGLTAGGTLGASNKQNTAMGYQALNANSSGIQNVAFGFLALKSNITGVANVAIGSQALQLNTASYSTAVGLQALTHTTTGGSNNAFGSGALWSNTTGTLNNAIGANSLYFNTTGNYNTASGHLALYSNTVGSSNTGVGYQALYNNTAGGNVAVGYQALFSNLNEGWNTAVGTEALYRNTGVANTAVGNVALYFNDTGQMNTGVGDESLSSNTTGSYNTGVGRNSLTQNITGNDNSSLGFGSGPNTGLNNLSNTTALGTLTFTTASNQVRIGNSSVTSIGGYANWTNISDGRVKKNIRKNVPGLVFINKLTPITYNLNLEEVDNILQTSPIKDKNGNMINPSQEQIQDRKQKEQVSYSGFIAQDVETAAKSLSYDFSGIDSAKNDKDLYGLRYSDFVVPIVKAIQELSVKNDSLVFENSQMQSKIAILSRKVDSILSLQNTAKNNISQESETNRIQSVTIQESGILEQNMPNPFNKNTSIQYKISEKSKNAKIIITDISGNILKTILISGKGLGQVVINAGSLPSGNYIYSLVVDNQKIQSKQMILTK